MKKRPKVTPQDFFLDYSAEIYSIFQSSMLSESKRSATEPLFPYGIMEDLRRNPAIRKKDGKEFKIANGYRAFYLRLFLHRYDYLKSRIKLCKSIADQMTAQEMDALIKFGKVEANVFVPTLF